MDQYIYNYTGNMSKFLVNLLESISGITRRLNSWSEIPAVIVGARRPMIGSVCRYRDHRRVPCGRATLGEREQRHQELQ